jgi:hypothetical protein
MTALDNTREAVEHLRSEVQDRMLRLSEEMDASAERVRELMDQVGDTPLVYVASDLGRLYRQPFGQNAQEFLFRDLANLAYLEGQLAAMEDDDV